MDIEGSICSQNKVDECQTVKLVFDNSQQHPDLDYSELSQVWAVAFTTVLFLWLFSHGIGQILKLVKNA